MDKRTSDDIANVFGRVLDVLTRADHHVNGAAITALAALLQRAAVYVDKFREGVWVVTEDPDDIGYFLEDLSKQQEQGGTDAVESR